MLYVLILVAGIARFIRRRSQLEPFFWLLASSGVELAIERLAFFNFDLVPSCGATPYTPAGSTASCSRRTTE